MQGSISVTARSLFSTSYNRTTDIQPMKIIFLLSALAMSIAPVNAQEEWSAREKSIYFAGLIAGSAELSCLIQKDGGITSEKRQAFLENVLKSGLESPEFNAEPNHLSIVYEQVIDCP